MKHPPDSRELNIDKKNVTIKPNIRFADIKMEDIVLIELNNGEQWLLDHQERIRRVSEAHRYRFAKKISSVKKNGTLSLSSVTGDFGFSTDKVKKITYLRNCSKYFINKTSGNIDICV